MLEDFTVAAAHDALQPSSNLTLAQIVVWQTRNPFPPKTRTINCSDWSSHSFAVSRGLINAVTGEVDFQVSDYATQYKRAPLLE